MVDYAESQKPSMTTPRFIVDGETWSGIFSGEKIGDTPGDISWILSLWARSPQKIGDYRGLGRVPPKRLGLTIFDPQIFWSFLGSDTIHVSQKLRMRGFKQTRRWLWQPWPVMDWHCHIAISLCEQIGMWSSVLFQVPWRFSFSTLRWVAVLGPTGKVDRPQKCIVFTQNMRINMDKPWHFGGFTLW